MNDFDITEQNFDESLSNLNLLQHEYMSRFIDDMIATLQSVGASMGYDSSSEQMSDEYLRKLVFSGSLEDSEAFTETYPEFNERQKISALGLSEKTGVTQYYEVYLDGVVTESITPIADPVNNSEPCF